MDPTAPSLFQLQQFRQAVYDSFPLRADALMELPDALSGNTTARSVVELSLNPLFRRGYSSITHAIDGLLAALSQATAGAASGLEAPSSVRPVAPYAPQPAGCGPDYAADGDTGAGAQTAG